MPDGVVADCAGGDCAGVVDDVDTPTPPPTPTGGAIFTGLRAVETDFGGKSHPSAHAHAPAAHPPPPSTDRTFAGDLHTSTARPALANIRINPQG